MSNEQATVQHLYEIYRETFGLQWLAGQNAKNNPLVPESTNKTSRLAGHFSPIHSYCIQVLSSPDLDYLANLETKQYTETIEQFFNNQPALIIVTNNNAPDEFINLCREKNIPLFSASVSSETIISELQYYLSGASSGRVTIHGVFMEVVGIGILLTGESGIGKSELALELISRGHRLIADDAPLFYKLPPDILNGICSDVLQDFLEVRGLGMLNIRAMFGNNAMKNNKYLKLIINLKKMSDKELKNIDRFEGNISQQDILGVKMPQITLPVAPGRNMAVLVENAARNHVLKLRGYSAAGEFIKRQKQKIEQQDTL